MAKETGSARSREHVDTTSGKYDSRSWLCNKVECGIALFISLLPGRLQHRAWLSPVKTWRLQTSLRKKEAGNSKVLPQVATGPSWSNHSLSENWPRLEMEKIVLAKFLP